MSGNTTKKTIETITHDEASRKNIPTAEYQSIMAKDEQNPVRVAYERRNRDLDPQLIWRGKDEQDWSDLVVHAPPLYIQEKIHPKALIDDLIRRTKVQEKAEDQQLNLFADFNGLPDENARTEFYQHDANWTNRMILGDSLQVMASLAEREGLRGKVQCIYIDPPYGIKFNSNFQWSTTSRDVKDGNVDHITREPEQVKAFRDTWRDGIHSYLTYLRDRLTLARDLLTESGSIFVQIGDENVHRVRALMDEVFGESNFVSEILLKKGGTATSNYLPTTSDFILFYAKKIETLKYRQLFFSKEIGIGESTGQRYDQLELQNGKRRALSIDEKKNPNLIPSDGRPFKYSNPCSMHENHYHRVNPLIVNGCPFTPPSDRQWSSHPDLMKRVVLSNRIVSTGKNLAYVMYIDDYPVVPVNNFWTDALLRSAKQYIVETAPLVIARCILMTTDPGDLVLDPTCGSGTTAYVAEQWGRRWITIDTSRVALTLARARLMGARYPYYLLADSRDGQIKEAEVTRTVPSIAPTRGDIRQGFVYELVPHITLKSIANNAEIDVIWEKYQEILEPLREKLNKALSENWEEWEIPRDADKKWPNETKEIHSQWWKHRITRQKEIDSSIAAKAEFEYLYDKPYEDKKKVRVAGPFTVESLSPHRVLGVDENDELIDKLAESTEGYGEERGFVRMILENLKTSGVQQAHKEDKINFASIKPWPGDLICAEGRYTEGDEESAAEKRAAIFIGPEFGTVSRPDLVAAAREAGDADFDVLITCAFNYDAHSSEFAKLGRIPVLKARMNADLHMADDLKNTGKGNLFVIFGEPDIDILDAGNGQIQVKINGVDVFHPNTGEVRSDGAEGIACWFIDTDYNEESFFVHHAYFLGANDPYKALKTTLKAEINAEAWEALHSDTSRPFDKPTRGRIAVKVINHLGDEVMKVFRVKG
ncbi:MAG TPA: site-specific DNA-methyltransferase [Desulfotomaculum sp.]|nr:MAG: DNA methylase N-4/N-6 domain protein [Desulfotomaculum sp. 46_80]HAG10676.1 site-specific DNA-methyltransferase [Desulfotomaculum sp.]HBY03801.1 site-specific DNA-methyltransferase [Desulfotomaculum sp.]